MHDDIAVFELAEELSFADRVQAICLPESYKGQPGEMGFVIGRGRYDRTLLTVDDEADHSQILGKT